MLTFTNYCLKKRMPFFKKGVIMENQCSHGSCSYEAHHANPHYEGHQGCSCHSEDGCHKHQEEEECQIEKEKKMWFCAFHQAMQEVHIEILKEKIKKSWGDGLNKSADAVMETLEIKWKAQMTKEKAKADLKTKLAQIMTAKP